MIPGDGHDRRGIEHSVVDGIGQGREPIAVIVAERDNRRGERSGAVGIGLGDRRAAIGRAVGQGRDPENQETVPDTFLTPFLLHRFSCTVSPAEFVTTGDTAFPQEKGSPLPKRPTGCSAQETAVLFFVV